jgi:hypothetical protein
MPDQLTSEAVDQTPDVTPADVMDEGACLDELVKLSPIAYDQRREAVAKQLNIRVGTLDTEVAKRRPQHSPSEGQGTPVTFEDPPRWRFEVPGAVLLNNLAQVYAAHLILPGVKTSPKRPVAGVSTALLLASPSGWRPGSERSGMHTATATAPGRPRRLSK